MPETDLQQGLLECVRRLENKPVLVIGDLMLDEFVWGSVRRISPEAPVPVVEVERQTYRPGGAANVASNIVALGGSPHTIGVVGSDSSGVQLRALLGEHQVDPGLIVETSRRTTLKTRIIANHQQVVRADQEDRTPLDGHAIDELSAAFDRAIGEVEVVVVSDYDKGVIDPRLLERILPKARRAGVQVFLDPKTTHADHYRPITMLTPNHAEAAQLSRMPIRDEASLFAAGTALLQRFGCPYVLVTRGEDGMTLFEEGASHRIPATAREVFDVTGAGDTVIATLALSAAAGASMLEAAWLANYAAGIAVGKVGTATVRTDELAAAIDAR